MNGPRRALAGAVLLLALLLPSLFSFSPAAWADLPACTCPELGGCYHWLNAPVSSPDDPCPCPRCRAKRGSCPKKLPEGWDAACANNRKMECFLRRHGASWHFACSERLAGTCDCDNPHPEWCPKCGRNGAPWAEEGLEFVRKQIEIERPLLGARTKFIVIRSEHFYLVTDMDSLKVLTQRGNWRVMRMHEIAHLFLQRAEIAYRDFVGTFGDRLYIRRPMAIYLLDDESVKEDLATKYFGLPEPELYYGADIGEIGGGSAWNGCAISKRKYRTDLDLHHQMRHLIGHLLISCWIKGGGSNDILPRWFYAAVGHWLSRLPVKLSETANFCAGEGRQVKDQGEDWRKKLVVWAASPRRTHSVQEIFSVNTLGGLDLQTHVIAWSWFDLWLAEDRERFLKFLAALREPKDPRTALQEAFGYGPEEFEQRWRDRILGKRDSVASTPEERDAADPDAPGARVRESIRSESDPDALAAKVRTLQRVDDPLTAATIVPLLAHPSEQVQETVVVVLSRTTDPAVRMWLRTAGLQNTSGLARAGVARIIGNIPDGEAGPSLLRLLTDGAWLVRAHAALALGTIRYAPATEALKELVGDRAAKVRIAAMDALGPFGERAVSAWEPVSEQLGAAQWQVRSAAAECLGALGDMHAVEPLIDRMEIESGRIRVDIRAALKAITRDDLGNNPKYWRDWWDKEKERAGGRVPARGEEPKDPPKGEHDYSLEPTYYGLRVFSRGVGYVLDVSTSMASTIALDEDWLKRHRREYPAEAPKFDLATAEIAASLRSLDPRTRFNLYFFRTVVATWKSSMVPASKSNVESAVGRIAAERPRRDVGRGQFRTNYVDAFREVLGEKKGAARSAGFPDSPDTMYFLTDGRPTAGDITHPDVLLSWFRERNRFARIRVHVITYGSLDVDPKFLRALAEENGGKFVQVPQKM